MGTATVTVIAADTGSDARAFTEFVAEAKVQPVISSVAVSPATVASYVTATNPETATITAVFNEGVQSLTYELENAPDWVTNDGNIIYVAPQTSAATATVTAIAKDTENSLQASTTFVAMVENTPVARNFTTSAQGWPANTTDTVDVFIGGSRMVSILPANYGKPSKYEVETDCDWITANGTDTLWLGELHLDPPATLSPGDYPVTLKTTYASQYNPNNSVTVEKPILIQARDTLGTAAIQFSSGARTPETVSTGLDKSLGMQVTLNGAANYPRRYNRIEIVSGASFTNAVDRNVTVSTVDSVKVKSVSLTRMFRVPYSGNFSIVVRFIFDDGTRSSGNFTFNYKR